MSKNENIVTLNSENIPKISEVGGKGYSLIKLHSLNANVPNGIVLTVNFFNEWISKIKNTDLHKQFLELLDNENQLDNCSLILNKIKEWCLENLSLTEENVNDIKKSLKTIFPNEYDSILYAVRSSSPEEDLFGASFAGNYETYLGIKFDSIEKYVLKSFISCLDFRVFKYKLEKGFDVSDIKIAIVVMKQINCDVSGVGFSINPLNNDYDEAVVTSNFGLGESVVGGIITPDEYIVNKLTKSIVSKKLGTKDKVVKLNDDENETCIIQQTEENKKQSSLNDELLLAIVDNIITIEKNYEIPIDIEFGVENNILYILQARPITTYNEIPKNIFTEDNEQRQLYFDATYAIQGLEKPLSTLGASVLKMFGHNVGEKILGSYNIDDIREGVADFHGGKMLINISNLLTKLSAKTLSGFFGNFNSQLSEFLLEHGEEYTNKKKCYEIDVSILGMAWRLPVIRMIFYKYFAPSSLNNLNKAFEDFINSNEKYLKDIKDNVITDVSVLSFSQKILSEMATIIRDKIAPVLAPAIVGGYSKLNKIFDDNFKDQPELKGDLNNLTRSLPFITILMGLDQYKLTKSLDKNYYQNKSKDEFYEDFLNKKFPDSFYKDYEIFMKKYGFRGEGEIDIRNDRYNENPRPIINQIYTSLLTDDENNNPLKDYEENNAKRPEIFKKLQSMLKNKKDAKAFEEAFHYVVNYFYIRESPKYHIIFAFSKIKELILSKTKILLEKNLIDDIDDIYKLKIGSLNDILENTDKYTKEKIYEQMEKDNGDNVIFNSWKRTPVIFDSRGRMFTPEKKVTGKKNELVGESVSFGKIRGKAKVLNTVDEKEFNPGEILITRATDPGWTPLIINCGGIVLEVGGMLQHGALVSREFNKPCVVGIENVTSIVKDGEEVEVDAIEGILRLLDREE